MSHGVNLMVLFCKSCPRQKVAGTERIQRNKSKILINPTTFMFAADHPFLFYLIDVKMDGIPLFAGKLFDPLSQ